MDTDLSPPDDQYLYHEEIMATLLSVAEITSIPTNRAGALVLRQFEGDSFEALERRLYWNHSLR